MSLFSLERALWDLSGNPENIQRYLQDPDEFLSGYALDDTERDLVKNKDVRAMADLGSSQMLLMLYWLAVSGGFESLPEYLGRMNTPAA